jgi:competence protein ComGC
MFGVHRFYLGRVWLGLSMLVTLGGLGIWALVDFILAFLGKLKDGEGRYVNRPIGYATSIPFIVVVCLSIVFFIACFKLVALPQYQKNRVMALESVIEPQLKILNLCQNNYYASNNKYSSNINDLKDLGYRDKISFKVNSIRLYTDNQTNTPCYEVTFTHRYINTTQIRDFCYKKNPY